MIKEYRHHNCDVRHKTFKTVAKCIWYTDKVTGEGSFAAILPDSVILCTDATTALQITSNVIQISSPCVTISEWDRQWEISREKARLVTEKQNRKPFWGRVSDVFRR